MLEANLYPLLVDGAIEEGWSLFRIADGSAGKKPFDICGSDPHGRAVGLEVKVVRSEFRPDQPIPWPLFDTHQKGWLKQFGKIGALSLIGLYRERSGEMGIYQLKRKADFDRPASALFKGELLRVDREYRGWKRLLETIGTPKTS